jgi:hypothetical protein
VRRATRLDRYGSFQIEDVSCPKRTANDPGAVVFHSYHLLYRVIAADHEVHVLAFVRDLARALEED